MVKLKHRMPPPRWFFSVLAIGAFMASGIYLGIVHVEGAAAAHVIRSVCYGILGLIMMWGVLGKRIED